MSVTSSSESSTREASDVARPDTEASRPEPGLNQPVRALIAAGEVALACVAVWLAFRLWSHGITEIQYPVTGGTDITVTLYHGDVITAAIGLGALASLLLLDAARQCMLALRARPVRAKRRERARERDERMARESSGSSSAAAY